MHWNRRTILTTVLTICVVAALALFAPAAFLPTDTRGAENASRRLDQDAEARAAAMLLPAQRIIPGGTHVFQTFNNCAPAALSIALSFYGIQADQEELAEELRPYRNARGDNDDKSTLPSELAAKARAYGLIPYFRPNGSVEMVKRFIFEGMPVLVRTRLHADDDIAHYRVIKGYDDVAGVFIQDDSFQGRNVRYSYAEFQKIWKSFNFEYLVLAPREKDGIARAILGDDLDELSAWRNALRSAESDLVNDPDDVEARFNLSVAAFYLGDNERSVEEFEKVEHSLEPRVLWYQLEPVEAYFQLGNYERLFSLSESILVRENRAYAELYLLRGKSYFAQGKVELAKKEFEKALQYNKNYTEARDALAQL